MAQRKSPRRLAKARRVAHFAQLAAAEVAAPSHKLSWADLAVTRCKTALLCTARST